jgi:hypothetical protein
MFDEYESDLTLDFDTGAQQYAVEVGDYDPIPEGKYHAVVAKTEIKPTKDETGKRLVVHLKIIGPQFAGRTVIVGLNVVNRNPKAEEIARRQLAQLLQAIDMWGERDMSKIHGAELEVLVVVKPEQNGYKASNDVKKFLRIDGPGDGVAPAPAKGPAPTKKAPAFMR